LAATFSIFLISALALAAAFFFAAGAQPAWGAGTLTVTMDRMLTQVNETPAFTVSGDAVAGLVPTDFLAVTISGPASLAQVAEGDPTLPEAGSFSVGAGSLPAAARPTSSELHVPVPLASLPTTPGAYRVTVEIRSGVGPAATGSAWMGRVAVRSQPLDVAFVWRAALGVHRGAGGTFFDTALEQACNPSAEDPFAGDLLALIVLRDTFPDWHFSLGIEPVLLAQLRDMADGFVRVDASGAQVEVGAGDPPAKNAAAVLAGLTGVGADDHVEVATSPYSGPDLGLLATQGWRDGFEQVQLGKQELVQTMSLALRPSGAWSPGLDLTTGSLSDYGKASIDHVLVGSEVAPDLNEPVAQGTVSVRAHDGESDRVTLILADSDLRALMDSPWDASVLFAGIAALLASGDRDSLVLTPAPEYALPPAEYLEAIGKELGKDSWIRSQTMTGLLRAHPPGTRPLLLSRDPIPPPGYVAQTIFSAVQKAHAAVADLAAAADITSLALESARRSLYVSESRWWYRPGVTPEEASAGLGYAVQAETSTKAELAKIGLEDPGEARLFGRAGRVKLVARNGADYPVTVELRLSGRGLTFPEGNLVKVRLESGGNEIIVPIVGTSSAKELVTSLAAGSTILDQATVPLRFLTLADILPWAALAAVVLVVAVLGLVLARRRKKGGTA
jgi:hypothetical protein